jgi:molybdopterin converting factor small subunit
MTDMRASSVLPCEKIPRIQLAFRLDGLLENMVKISISAYLNIHNCFVVADGEPAAIDCRMVHSVAFYCRWFSYIIILLFNLGGELKMIQVLLYATLRSFGPDGKGDFQLEVPAGTKVIDVIHKLKMPIEEVKLAMVNGVSKDFEHVLAEGDRLGFFPPVGGG